MSGAGARGRRAGGNQAFTLIELLVVIIIIAVVSSVVVPAYSRFYSSTRFDSDVAQVAGVFDYARAAAIEYQTDVTVDFNAQANSFNVTIGTTDDGSDAPTAQQPGHAGATGGSADAQAMVASAPQGRTVPLGEELTVVDFEPEGDASQTSPASTASGAASSSTSSLARQLTFHDDGRADGWRVDLAGEDGRQSSIHVLPATGRVKIESNGDQGP